MSQPAAVITLQDLLHIREIIDLAARRGAFAATELSQVGQTYDRLAAYLDALPTAPGTLSEDTQGESQ
jgi:hypothetical protein